jgi:hypothetical protein
MEKWEDLLASLDPEYQAQSLRIPGMTDLQPMGNPDVPIQVPPPLAKTPQRVPAVVPQEPSEASKIVTPYITDKYIAPEKKKFDMGEYSDENRKKLETENGKYDFGGRLSAAAAALGAGLMGGNAASAGGDMLARMDAQKKGKLDAFDKGRSGHIEKFSLDEAANKTALEDDRFNRESDVGSQESDLARTLANKMAPGVDFSKMNARQINEKIPALQKIYDIEAEKLRLEENRKDRWAMHGQNLEDKKEARQQKNAELSAVQSKQKGLYESGMLANEQYEKAISSGEYDPSSYLEFIDNDSIPFGLAPNGLKSAGAQQAGAAQDAWVEAFLRDASGAAIPETERGPYKKQFFEQPGDSDATKQNKRALREQKMENARVGAGGDLDASAIPRKPSGNRQVVKKQVNKKTGQTKLIYSDGTEEIQ